MAIKTIYNINKSLLKTKDNKGEEGVKNFQFWDNIVYGQPLRGFLVLLSSKERLSYPRLCLGKYALNIWFLEPHSSKIHALQRFGVLQIVKIEIPKIC